MKGLDISYEYYTQLVEPALKEQFPELLPLVAAGLCGSGSECLGFDDEISQDHDFEPGCCLFIPSEDAVDRRTAFQLQRMYDKLPREFMGLKRGLVAPAGGARKGVLRIGEFVKDRTGTEDGMLTLEQWYKLPEQYLLELTNGRLFYDGLGLMTELRRQLAFLPEDVRLKKLSDSLLAMGQAGQYNYARCMAHGEPEAAAMAIGEYVREGLHALFLLNRQYMPYYKWSFKALRAMDGMDHPAELLSRLLLDSMSQTDTIIAIEDFASFIIGALSIQGLTQAVCGDLTKHAASVCDGITDSMLRNMR